MVPQESDFVPKDKNSSLDSQSDKPLDSSTRNLDKTLSLDSPLNRNENESGLGNPQSLDSDAPLTPPTFKLNDDSAADVETDEDLDSDNSKNNVKTEYQLPTVGNVNSPISATPLSNIAQTDPSGLLIDDQNVNSDQYVHNGMNYSAVTGTNSQFKYKTWKAHDFYHQPLYFEEPNVERHGDHRRFNNIASAVHFFGTIPRLPQMIGDQCPSERVYTLGQYRPGDYTQFRIQTPQRTRRGVALQALISTAIILP